MRLPSLLRSVTWSRLNKMLHTSYIGIGSNLPFKNYSSSEVLAEAVESLRSLGTVRQQSQIYRTEPLLYLNQPSFKNAVVELETELEPEPLLEELMKIELSFGRNRKAASVKGPRTLDLDLLLVDDLCLETPILTLPHPGVALRRFVLAPLAEIAPLLRHPVLGQTMQELLELLPTEGENGRKSVQLEEER